MRTLAIDTSTREASIAVLDQGQLVAEISLDPHVRTTQSLLPALTGLLAQAGWKTADLQLIAVSHGPGSFTGLRIGVTVAKTLAYATGCAVAGVCTLAVLAEQAPVVEPRDGPRWIYPVLDAQRGQLFVGTWQVTSDGTRQQRGPVSIEERETWLGKLTPHAVVIGQGLAGLTERVPAEVSVAPQKTWVPRAATVGLLGYRRCLAGETDDLWSLAPRYVRQSAAEEKLRGRSSPEKGDEDIFPGDLARMGKL